MAERLIATVLKTVEGASLPGVQIPLLPPNFLSVAQRYAHLPWAQVVAGSIPAAQTIFLVLRMVGLLPVLQLCAGAVPLGGGLFISEVL